MGTFVGIWYPPRTSGVSALDRASVSSIASRLVGVPVTYNHAGTVSAFVASGGNSAITFSDFGESPLMAVVGGITAACVLPDGTGLCRGHILGAYPSVAAVVASGGVGLSLTHVMSSLAPVEMTLTASPARAGSVIVDTGLSALKYYMRALATPENTAIMDTTPESAATTPAPEAAPSAVETVLSSLSAADRAIVEERLSAMASSAIAANAARTAAETRLADSAIGADHQNSMIRDQLANLSALFTPAEVKRYNLGGDAIAPQVESSSPDVLKALMGRTIMACSNEMLRLNSELDSQRAPKRARGEAPPPTASAAAAAPATTTPSAALRAALGHQFEPAGYTL